MLSINLAASAKAYAFIKKRLCNSEDIRALCHDVLRHRIGLIYEAEAENITPEIIITEILNAVGDSINEHFSTFKKSKTN